MTKALTKDDFLKAIKSNVKIEKRDVAGFGELYIKKLTVAEQGKLYTHAKDGNDIANAVRFIAYSIVDKDGEPWFDDEDVKALQNMSIDQLTALTDAVNDVNGIDTTDAKKN